MRRRHEGIEKGVIGWTWDERVDEGRTRGKGREGAGQINKWTGSGTVRYIDATCADRCESCQPLIRASLHSTRQWPREKALFVRRGGKPGSNSGQGGYTLGIPSEAPLRPLRYSPSPASPYLSIRQAAALARARIRAHCGGRARSPTRTTTPPRAARGAIRPRSPLPACASRQQRSLERSHTLKSKATHSEERGDNPTNTTHAM
jgi:hypothetical protein